MAGMLTKQIDFKAQTQIGLIAGALSGIAGITLAVMSYGVWSGIRRLVMTHSKVVVCRASMPAAP